MFRVGEPVVQGTTLPQHFRVGDFIIINPELISEFRTGKFLSYNGIILKNGELYDGELKYGCVILSIANDEVNQYYNSERYCLDANLAMVIYGDDWFGIGFVDLKDFVVPSQEQLQEISNYKLCKLYQSGIINDLARLRYDCTRWQNYNVPIFEKAQDMFSAAVCFLEDSDGKYNRADELKNYLELFLKTECNHTDELCSSDREYRRYDYSVYYGDRIRDDEIKDFDDEFVARGYLSYKFESQDDDVGSLPF